VRPIALLPLLLASGCSRTEPVLSLAAPSLGAGPCKPPGLRYNQVRQISSHNSYDRCGLNPLRCSPKGSLEQQADVGVRSFELDLWSQGRGPGAADPPPADWAVFHATNMRHGGDHCERLSQCLQKLRGWHEAHPGHEVITLWLELKRGWSNGHSPAELDRRLQAQLGDTMLRPPQLMARCPRARSLQEALRSCQWPTLDELRGKVLVVLMGNNRAARDYLETVDGGRSRPCFVAPELAGSGASTLRDWPGAVFFNLHNTDGMAGARLAFSENLVSRVWRLDGTSEWQEAREGRAHHLATDAVMADLQEPRAVDRCGQPFEVIR
jgi:hypothetical protein